MATRFSSIAWISISVTGLSGRSGLGACSPASGAVQAAAPSAATRGMVSALDRRDGGRMASVPSRPERPVLGHCAQLDQNVKRTLQDVMSAIRSSALAGPQRTPGRRNGLSGSSPLRMLRYPSSSPARNLRIASSIGPTTPVLGRIVVSEVQEFPSPALGTRLQKPGQAPRLFDRVGDDPPAFDADRETDGNLQNAIVIHASTVEPGLDTLPIRPISNRSPVSNSTNLVTIPGVASRTYRRACVAAGSGCRIRGTR